MRWISARSDIGTFCFATAYSSRAQADALGRPPPQLSPRPVSIRCAIVGSYVLGYVYVLGR
jgi:hypothetical protein